MTFGEKLKKARIESGLSQELPQHIGEKKFMIGELRYKRLYRLK